MTDPYGVIYYVPGPNGTLISVDNQQTDYGLARPLLVVNLSNQTRHVFCWADGTSQEFGDFRHDVSAAGVLTVEVPGQVLMRYSPTGWAAVRPWTPAEGSDLED